MQPISSSKTAYRLLNALSQAKGAISQSITLQPMHFKKTCTFYVAATLTLYSAPGIFLFAVPVGLVCGVGTAGAGWHQR